MLKQRLLTAAVLMPLALWAVLALPAAPFALLIGIVALIGFWEWSALLTPKRGGRRLYLLLALLAMAGLWFWPDQQLVQDTLPWLGLFWFALGVKLVARYPAIATLWRTHLPLRGLVGALMLLPTWYVLLLLQQQDPKLLIALLLIVWAVDIGAYFSGRRWGRTKLAPAISPVRAGRASWGGRY